MYYSGFIGSGKVRKGRCEYSVLSYLNPSTYLCFLIAEHFTDFAQVQTVDFVRVVIVQKKSFVCRLAQEQTNFFKRSNRPKRSQKQVALKILRHQEATTLSQHLYWGLEITQGYQKRSQLLPEFHFQMNQNFLKFDSLLLASHTRRTCISLKKLSKFGTGERYNKMHCNLFNQSKKDS